MAEWTVPELVEDLKAGRIERRQFVRKLVGAGISLPMIVGLLAACGSDKSTTSKATTTAGTQAPAAASSGSPAAGGASAAVVGHQTPGFNPTKRGGGGTVKLLYWQAPTILNGHLSDGAKDRQASSVFYEPLAQIDQDANLIPVLAAEAPSVAKQTLDPGGKFVVWKLKKGVQWHDGKPFSADDVVFTYQWLTDKDTGAFTAGSYKDIASVEKVDDLTVRVTFKEPTLLWAVPFVAQVGQIIPKHVYEGFKGAQARNAPANLKPVGTGPFKLTEFRPNDIVLADINTSYHVENRPFFDKVEIKGGGDAPSAARAVLQTGDYDFAWNMGAVQGDVLARLEKEGMGSVIAFDGGTIEHISLNRSDPNVEVDGEKASAKSKHPFFEDLKVRQAVALAMNKKVIVDQLYGPTGDVAHFYSYTPKKYVPDGGKSDYNLQRANQLLDEAGWRKGSDGVRTKDGKRMKVLFQTSVNQLRQNEQAIIKKDMEQIGFEVELKSVDAGVYFGGDPANPDNIGHFFADMQMYAATRDGGPDALPDFFLSFLSTEISQKANNYSKQNRNRYVNPQFDTLYNQAVKETDAAKAADLYKKMNQILIDDVAVIPLVARKTVIAVKKNLKGVEPTSGWDSDLWRIGYWYRS